MRTTIFAALAAVAVAVALAFPREAIAADAAPAGRWVSTGADTRMVLHVLSDSTYALFVKKGDAISTSFGTFAVKDGRLTLTPKEGKALEFTYARDGLHLSLTAVGTKGEASFFLNFGPLVGRWRAESGATWVFSAEGEVDAGDGSKGTYEPIYSFPGEADGEVIVHVGPSVGSLHLAFEENGARLVLSGGAGAKDQVLRLTRVADEGNSAPAPGGAPSDASKLRKFPEPPPLPGPGGAPTPTPTPGAAPSTPGSAPKSTPPGTGAGPATPPAPAKPPGMEWDTAKFEEKGFKVVKSTYDPAAGTMEWVLEATRDVTTYVTAHVDYLDADGVSILYSVVFTAPPGAKVKQGARVKAFTTAPEAARKRAAKAVVTDAD